MATKIKSYQMHRLFILLFLLFFTSNVFAMRLFEPNGGPKPLNFELGQAPLQSRLAASWNLSKQETLWSLIKRSVIDESLKNDPRFKKLSQNESIAILRASKLPITEYQLANIKDDEYNANELRRYIDEQKERLNYLSIREESSFLDFIVSIAALILDPITLGIFLLIGFFSKKYRSCLIFTLTATFILGIAVEKSQLPWSNLNQFNGAVWWLKLTLGGCIITLSCLTTKKYLEHVQKKEKAQSLEKTKQFRQNAQQASN